MKHTCHAYKCDKHVHPSHLMCVRHWNMVPADIRRRVLTHFEPNQCETKRPSMEWLKAAREAVNFVTKAEGNWETPIRPAPSTSEKK